MPFILRFSLLIFAAHFLEQKKIPETLFSIEEFILVNFFLHVSFPHRKALDVVFDLLKHSLEQNCFHLYFFASLYCPVLRKKTFLHWSHVVSIVFIRARQNRTAAASTP